MAARHSTQGQSAITLQRWLFLGYLVFVIYGSLVPLDFVAHPVDAALADLLALRDLPLDFSSRSDWATNLVLFIPLTFLALQSLGLRGLGRLPAGVLVALAASALAVAIEFTQMFFPPRTPSQNDIVALSISGAIGVLAQWAAGARVQAWLTGYWHYEKQSDKISRLLKAYLFVLFAFNVMPLDLAISPVEIFHKWRDGHLILLPFGGLKGSPAEMLYQVLSDILIWVPAGALWALRPGHGIWRVARKGLLAAATVEFLQLFVMSRTTDITSVGLAALGCALGAVGVLRVAHKTLGLSHVASNTWLAWWGGWLLATLAVFWLPFDFDTARLSWAAVVEAFTRTPLNNYYFESEFMALNEVLRKIGFFIPGGLLLALSGLAPHTGGRKPSARPVWVLFLCALLVESGQLLLPERVADLTDFLLESLGGLIGYKIAYWIGQPRIHPTPMTSTPAPHTAPAALAPHSASTPLSSLDSGHMALYAVPKPPIGYKTHLLWWALTAVLLGVLLNLPFVPYNLRELVEPGAWGVVSVAGLALALHWIANAPFLLLPAQRRPYLLALPLTLLGHGLVTWVLLRISVPLESIYDVAGSPVLGWPWEWELMGRYLGLHVAVMLQVLGAVLLVRTLQRTNTLSDVVYWLMVSLILAWPLYTLNVTWADTDNLVELMGDHASFSAASAMAAGLLMACLAGTALSAAAVRGCPKRWRLLGVSVFSAGTATLLFWAGAEHLIVKYGQAFSAFQFLLSSDREHYAHGLNLALRYALAFAGVTGGLAMVQWMGWRDWLRQDLARAMARRAKQSGATRPMPLQARDSSQIGL